MAQRQFRSDDTDRWIHGFGNGSDGALSITSNTTEAPIDSACTGTAGTTSLSATNTSFAAGQIILIHQTRKSSGAGVWELNKIASYTAGTITTAHALINTYASLSQVRVLKQYSSVTVTSGDTYTSKAWNGTVGGIIGFFCNGTVTIEGTITATGKGFRGGNGSSGGDQAYSGEGNEGASAASTANTGNGSGGSSGNDRGGTGGSHGTQGAYGTYYGGTAGVKGDVVGTSELTELFLGGGGGGGADNGSPAAGVGGAGGGIIFIAAPSITVTGVMSSNGSQGTVGGDGSTTASGSGAGGAILMKVINATLGTNLVTSGGGATVEADRKGGAGGSGYIHADYSGEVTGTTAPTIDTTNDESIVPNAGGAFLFNFI